MIWVNGFFSFFRFSGISASDLDGVTTNIRDVQAVLLSMFSAKTILIGHSLESDLKALKVSLISSLYLNQFIMSSYPRCCTRR